MRNAQCVGMGEFYISSDAEAELVCLGLGSCIAICAYAPRKQTGAMAHVVLPTAPASYAEKTAKYADIAVPYFVEEFRARGIMPSELRVVLCGGAAIFAQLSKSNDIGMRNLLAVRDNLQAHGCKVLKEDVGGTTSRSVTLNVATGTVRLRTVQTGEIVFATLGNGA